MKTELTKFPMFSKWRNIKILCLLFLLLGTTAKISAQTTLAVGDISIIGWNSNAPDNFAFVAWVPIANNTYIKFTDNGFLSSGSANLSSNARGGENFVIWRNNTGTTIAEGTVITILDNSGTAVTNVGSIVSGNLSGISGGGDNIFAYQGPATSGANPDFSSNSTTTTFNGTILYGLQFQGTGSATSWLTSGSASSNATYLPSQLNVTNGNIAFGGSITRGQYTGSRTSQSNFADYKALVNNPANWTTGTGTSGYVTLSTTAFTLASGNTPPTIVMDVTTTSDYIDGGVASSPASPYAFSGVINDPTDPASTLGIDFIIGDAETAVGSLTVTVSSSNTTVVPTVNAVVTGTGANRHLTITPAAVGYSNISVNVNDGFTTTSYVIAYAASAAAVNPTATRYHIGRSDASTAVMIDSDYMLVADDENQALRLYNRTNSGLSINSFDFTTSLGLTDISGGIPREVDIESSVKVGSRIYWLGSHDNSSSGSNRPNRSRIFATDIVGSGAATTLTYVGRFDDLKTQLLAWDQSNAHGLGADYFGLVASAAVGVLPEAADGSGFNIEGLTMAPDNTTGYICFRAPISPASSRTDALIVPVTNFTSLFSGNPTSATATFGTPILLDLGGRGIREIKKNAANQYLILAGPVDAATDIAPSNFELYAWSGVATDNPVALTTTLSSTDLKGSFEGIVDVSTSIANGNIVQLVVDNGDNVYYGDGLIAKDLAAGNHKKATSVNVTLAGVVYPPVVTSSLTATGVVGSAFSYMITADNSPSFYNATGLPANLTVNTSTGEISGTPATAGVYNVTITVSNATGSDIETLVLTVNATFTYYADVDGDTYGDPGNSITSSSTTPPSGYVTNNTDCDDNNSAINPLTNWYLDADNDNYYTGSAVVQCLSPGAGYTSAVLTGGGDCNDASATVNPGATEVCNTIDDDCDGATDEDVTTNYYADVDGDTYGAGVAIAACTSPGSGYVTINGDCNDNAAAVNPGATESCNGVDDDCDAQTDEGFDLNSNTIADCQEFIFSEVFINPPGTDNSQEYIEIKGAPNTALTNVRLLMIEGDATSAGVVDQNINLSSYSTGSNGLLLIRDAASLIAPAPDAGTSVVTLDFNPDIENGSNTFVLGIGSAPAVNTDLDSDNDGVLNVGALTGFTVTDAVSLIENDGVSNYGYADDLGYSVLGPFTGFNPDLFYRTFNSNGSSCVWAGGDVLGAVGGPYTFDFTTGAVFGFQQHGVSAGVSANPGSANTLFDVDNNGTANACEAITVSGVVTNESCQNLNDGVVDISVFGLTYPYSYLWSNGQVTQDVDSLDAGVYTVTVTGALGEVASASFTVNPGLVPVTFYADADNDTYGDLNVTVLSCTIPVGYELDNSDCNDGNAAVNPAATEICNGIDDDCDGDIDANDSDVPVQNWYSDVDSDGYGDALGIATLSGCPVAGMVTNNDDCDDGVAAVNPAATEICDNIDNDCDGLTDEGVSLTFYADTDGDGFGNAAVTATECYPAPGYVLDNSDCNDGNAAVNPAATEICNGIDDDCDGDIDANDSDVPVQNWYADVDGDGFGDASGAATVSGCPVAGMVTNNDDCDDGAAAINPAATEICDNIDNDCDGLTDEGVSLTFYADADGDGFGNAAVTATGCYPAPGFVLDNSDCNDANASVNPDATEICNGIDDDCDGDVDADDSDVPVQNWYADVDGDGYGDALGSATVSGCPVAGMVTNNDDCDDGASAVNPAATEICDNIDNDCDGQTDEGVSLTFYADADGDGFGNAAVTATGCYPAPGFILDNSDCNDANASVNPNATEICNGIDDDCDGDVDANDSDVPVQNWYADVDGDGFGDASGVATVSGCPVAGMVTNNDDCDDGASAVNPAATEICDNIDNDCDGQTDEGVSLTFYADADGDGFGNAAVTAIGCYPAPGYVLDNSDCNDANALVNPNATEICNGIDDDCDGDVDADDSDVPVQNYYADVDGDGFGDASGVATVSGCPVAGMVADNTDCDDNSNAVYPGAIEICDDLDNDCDGSTDEGLAFTTWYVDGDNDTYGGASLGSLCYQPVGAVSVGGDCNDGVASINPGAAEVCNSIDDNCNGTTDEGVLNTYYTDADNDTYGTGAPILACTQPANTALNNTDCNDANAGINPGATEICFNNIDEDCDGFTDEGCNNFTYYQDQDGDTYGNPLVFITSSNPVPPIGYVADNTDCNDANAAINPGATEICNNVDDNCNGLTDEGLTQITSTITATGGQFSFCPGTNVVINAEPNTVGNTYVWSTGETTPSISVNTVGTYSVTITNASGCSSTTSVNITLRYRASDFNQDGITDVQDFLTMVAVFNQPCTGCPQDLSGNGVVNVEDFLTFLNDFGLSCN